MLEPKLYQLITSASVYLRVHLFEITSDPNDNVTVHFFLKQITHGCVVRADFLVI